VKERRQFGKPLSAFQNTQFQLADMQTRVDAARLLVYRAACAKDAKLPYSAEAAMAKLGIGRRQLRDLAKEAGVKFHHAKPVPVSPDGSSVPLLRPDNSPYPDSMDILPDSFYTSHLFLPASSVHQNFSSETTSAAPAFFLFHRNTIVSVSRLCDNLPSLVLMIPDTTAEHNILPLYSLS
jgi:hypothetical protein